MPIRKKTTKNGTVKPLKEYLFKVLVIGELATGKTSFIKRYVHQYFSDHYKATIGVDFALKVLNWDENTVVRLQLWDIAGQERFGNMTRVYYKEAVGALISFDVSRPETLQHTINWKEDLDRKVSMADGSPIPCVLLANKCDMTRKGICADEELMKKFCEENNFSGWFYASPRDDINIEESTNFLIKQIIQKQNSLTYNTETDEEEIVNLNFNEYDYSNRSSTKKCSC